MMEAVILPRLEEAHRLIEHAAALCRVGNRESGHTARLGHGREVDERRDVGAGGQCAEVALEPGDLEVAGVVDDTQVEAVARTFGNLVDAAKQAEGKIAAAQQQLAGATSSRSTADLVTAASAAAEAVAEAVSAARHPLLSFELAGEEAPGSEVGALRRGRSGKAVSRPDQIEVWATVSDESRPYALAAIVAPLGLVSLVYIIGSLLLQSLDWPYSPVRIDVASDFAVAADAVVAVLLLFPGLALSQFRFPYRSSVTGRLRKAARLFVLTTAVGLCILAGVIATKVNTGASPDDVDVVVWTFRGTLAAFLMWLAWSLAAWAIRKWFVWRPKGLRALFDAGRLDGLPVSRRAIERIRTVLSFNQKAADADFDLTQGTGMSRKERR